MSRTATILLVVVLTLAASAGAEDPKPKIQPDARAFLTEVVEGMGGDAAIAKINGMRAGYNGSYAGSPFKSDVTWIAPNNMMFKLDAGVFAGSMGVNAGQVWTAFGCPPARAKGALAKSTLDWLDNYDVMLVRPLLHRGDVGIEMGATTIDGVAARTVLIAFPDGRKGKVSYAQVEGKWRMTASEGDMIHMDGRKGRYVAEYSKHASFGSVTIPAKTRTRTYVGDKLIEDITEEITSLEWNPKVPASTFAVPKFEQPLMKPVVKDVAAVRGLSAVHEGSYDGMGRTIGKLMAVLSERGLMQAGPVHAICLNSPEAVEKPEDLRTRIMVPCGFATPPKDLPEGVTVETRAAGKYASINARGPYGQADVAAMKALFAWMEKSGRTPGGPPCSLYSHDPATIIAEDLFSEVQVLVR